MVVLEIQLYRDEKALLLGVPGKVQEGRGERGRGLAITGVSGEPGTTAVLAVKGGDPQAQRLRVNGRDVPCRYDDGLLFTVLRFGGEKNPARIKLTSWKITREGGQVVGLETDFFRAGVRPKDPSGPEMALQSCPRYAELRGRTAWIDPSRFIISLPLRLQEDSLAHASACLNGQEIELHRNLMDNRRLSGLFLDATLEIRCGQTNRLELTMPGLRESDWIAAPVGFIVRGRPVKKVLVSYPGKKARDIDR